MSVKIRGRTGQGLGSSADQMCRSTAISYSLLTKVRAA
jgi:hypothetical protein